MGTFSVQADFRENDSQNSALFIPTNQISLTLGSDNDIDCLSKNFFRRPFSRFASRSIRTNGFRERSARRRSSVSMEWKTFSTKIFFLLCTI